MQEERLPASSRARERRRSYSASLSLWEAWLKAVRSQFGVTAMKQMRRVNGPRGLTAAS